MTTKLTLSVDKKTVKDIKRFAKQQGTSVSAMFSRFARAVTQKDRSEVVPGPLTRQATGMIKLPPGKSDRQLIEEALSEHYGLS